MIAFFDKSIENQLKGFLKTSNLNLTLLDDGITMLRIKGNENEVMKIIGLMADVGGLIFVSKTAAEHLYE